MNASSGLSGLGFLGYSAFYCIWKGLIPTEFQDTYSWISRLCMLITVRHIRIFKLGHRTRLSGIIPHFHVFSSYKCSSQLCTRFSSVLYNTHRFSLPLCVGLSLWSCWWIQRSGLLSFSPWTSPFLVWSSLTITLFCVPFFQMTYLHAPQHCSLSLCTLSLTSSHWSSQVSIQPLWRVVKPFPFSFLFPVVFLPFFTHIYLNILYLFYLLSRCYLCIASIISPLKIH